MHLPRQRPSRPHVSPPRLLTLKSHTPTESKNTQLVKPNTKDSDARVHDTVGHGERLEILLVDLGVGVEDDAGVEQELRVEEALQLPHRLSSLLAPLQLHVRRHVAPRPCPAAPLSPSLTLTHTTTLFQ